MQKLVHTQCLADAMDFKFSAGVGGTDGKPSCVDEHDGCPTEAYILCGFENIGASQQARVDFLACVDDEEGDAGSRAKVCATRQHLDEAKIESCATGPQGTELLQKAHVYYEANKDKVRGFPTLLVDGKEPWTRDWETVVKTICDAGVSCACNLPPPPSPAPSPVPRPVPEPTPVPVPVPVPSPSPTPVPVPRPTPVPSPDADCFAASSEAECGSTSREGKTCKWCQNWSMCFDPDVDCPTALSV